ADRSPAEPSRSGPHLARRAAPQSHPRARGHAPAAAGGGVRGELAGRSASSGPPVRPAPADRRDRAPSGRPAAAVPLARPRPPRGPCGRPRAHRRGLVARAVGRDPRGRRGARTRLLPRGGRDGRALLGVPHRALRRRPRRALVAAWGVRMTPAYAELQTTSNFSFLRGGSHPHELVAAAAELGLAALAVTDHNTLAGVVRAHSAAKELGVRFVVGARLDFADGTPSVL